MIINESFARCEKCSNGWFRKEEHATIAKGSETTEPIEESLAISYICTQCGHNQYNIKKD